MRSLITICIFGCTSTYCESMNSRYVAPAKSPQRRGNQTATPRPPITPPPTRRRPSVRSQVGPSLPTQQPARPQRARSTSSATALPSQARPHSTSRKSRVPQKLPPIQQVSVGPVGSVSLQPNHIVTTTERERASSGNLVCRVTSSPQTRARSFGLGREPKVLSSLRFELKNHWSRADKREIQKYFRAINLRELFRVYDYFLSFFLYMRRCESRFALREILFVIIFQGRYIFRGTELLADNFKYLLRINRRTNAVDTLGAIDSDKLTRQQYLQSGYREDLSMEGLLTSFYPSAHV